MNKPKMDVLTQTYLNWRVPLSRLLRRKVGNMADAEDLAQESFLRWAAAGNAAAPANPAAYVLKIAVRAVRDHARRPAGMFSAMTGDPDDYGAAPDADSPLQQASDRQILARLQTALEELPERQREALILHRFDGMTCDEVAARMGISVRMVSKHIARALAYCELRTQYPSAQAMRERHRAGDN